MLDDGSTREISLLYDLALFRGLDPGIADKHLEKSEYLLFNKGEIVVSPNSPQDGLYVVLSGVLSVHLDSPSADLVTTINVGECAGEVSLFDEGTPSAYVISLEDSRLLKMNSKIVWDMIDSCVGFARNFLYLASSRMRSSNLNISHSRRIQRHYANKANIDSLTRLYNRSWIDQNFPQVFDVCVADKTPLCLMMADIDDFKQYNDEHGHLAGDTCLKAVAEAIRTSIRPSDLLGRFGGEEFVLLLPGANIASSKIIAERIKSSVSQAEIINDKLEKLPSVTVSIGVCQGYENATYEDVLRMADAGLYKAKENGKNFIFYEDRRPLPG